MQPEGSLPPLQQPATGPYHEPDEAVHTFPPYLLKTHSNIIFPSYA
jgi:hypothetical protein